MTEITYDFNKIGFFDKSESGGVGNLVFDGDIGEDGSLFFDTPLSTLPLSIGASE